MWFQISEIVEEGWHAELIEKNDDEEHDVHQGNGSVQSWLLMTWIKVIQLDGTHNQFGLSSQDEVENYGDNDQHKKA